MENDSNRQEMLNMYKKACEENEEMKQAMIWKYRELKEMEEKYKETEDQLLALQSIGMLVGEIMQIVGRMRYLVKTTQGPRYLVVAREFIPSDELQIGARVALDMTTLTIMRILPPEVNQNVYGMIHRADTGVTFASIGGLGKELLEVKEVVELPIKNPEIFRSIGIKPPKGILLYGPPGTGKTLIAKAVANALDCTFIEIVASSIIEKYIGESAKMIREMFKYAKMHKPSIIFIDEIDAIGGMRNSEGSSSDREVQRTLLELLNQMDGFDDLENIKIIMATNRPDILDAALMRPGRIDKKIEIRLPTEAGRMEILRIYTRGMPIDGERGVHLDEIVAATKDFNGADLQNLCTEAGMYAIRHNRDAVRHDDFLKAVYKLREAKRHETKISYAEV